MPIVQENEQVGMIYKVMPRGIKPGQPQVVPAPISQTPPTGADSVARPYSAGANNLAANAAASLGVVPPPPNGPGVSSAPIDPYSQPASGSSRTVKMLMIIIAALLVIGVGVMAYVIVNKKNVEKKAEQARQEQLAQDEAKRKAAEDALKAQQSQSKISDEWRLQYFGATLCSDVANCGDDADPDKDGLSNFEEFSLVLDPNSPDSDADGLADGDEQHIFHYNPATSTTTGNTKFPDGYQAKTKWNTSAKREFNDAELIKIAADIKAFGLHIPTTTTLDAAMVNFYTNYGTPSAGTGLSQTLQPGALDRDTQRSDTIKQIGFALLKYKDANSGKYPDTADFAAMIAAIKPLLTGKAINTTDPLNTPPYTYGYLSVNAGVDFKLSYYSETQNQAIILDSKVIQSLYDKDQQTQRDTQRKTDLEQLAQALDLYSNENANSSDPNARMFPVQATWKTDLSPKYLATIPTDPQTKKDYEYTVNSDLTDFALQAALENPPTGEKGYLCTSAGCGYY